MDQSAQEELVALMMRVRSGDESAFEILFHRFQRPVLNFFHGLTRDNGLARELAQETFLRIWKIRRRYEAGRSFPAYLFGVARLIWLEWCRREKKTWRLGHRVDSEFLDELPGSHAANPERSAARRELHDRIHAALAELPEEQRMVFVLRTVEGLSLAEIADVLDCPINTVRSRKLLAVKKLRYLLGALFQAECGGEHDQKDPARTTLAGQSRSGRQ